jgi:hypothetical protein
MTRRYEDGDFSFEPPKECCDRSMVVFSESRAATSPSSVVVARERMTAASLRRHAAEYVEALRRRHPEMLVLSTTDHEVAGRGAVVTRVSDGDLYQAFVHVPSAPHAPEPLVTLVVLTTPRADDAMLERVLSSIRFEAPTTAFLARERIVALSQPRDTYDALVPMPGAVRRDG